MEKPEEKILAPTNMQELPTYIKCVSVGAADCGKTQMLISMAASRFPDSYIPTVFDNYVVNIDYRNRQYEIGLWDTAGHDEYDRLRPLSYLNTTIFLLCFSVNMPDTLEKIKTKFIPEIKYHCPNVPFLLVGIPIEPDISRTVSGEKYSPLNWQRGKEFAEEIGAFRYVAYSHKPEQGVTHMFQIIIDTLACSNFIKSNIRFFSPNKEKMARQIVNQYVTEQYLNEAQSALILHSTASGEGKAVTPPLLPPALPQGPANSSITENKGSVEIDRAKKLANNDPVKKEIVIIPPDDLEYHHTDFIGHGSFGQVYKGKFKDRPAAIKTLQTQMMDAQAKCTLHKEAELLVKLDNPFIVKLYGICQKQDELALVMEYAEGGNLYNFLRSSESIEWKIRFQYAIDIGEGLCYLHNKDILHNDLKSVNVVIKNGRALLCDFGFAQTKLTINQSPLSPTQAQGTTHWMAPELFTPEGKNTVETDVYSYAIVLWELTAPGKTIYAGKRKEAIPTLVKDGYREKIPEGTPSTIAALIGKCWHQRAKERGTMRDAVTVLKNEQKNYSNSP